MLNKNFMTGVISQLVELVTNDEISLESPVDRPLKYYYFKTLHILVREEISQLKNEFRGIIEKKGFLACRFIK